MTELITAVEMGKRLGVTPQTVYSHKKRGRLVMVGDKIDFAASMKRLKKSAQPGRKHNKTLQAVSSVEIDGEEPEQDDDDSFHAHKTRKEKYNALKAQAEYEELVGKLVTADSVQAAGVRLAALVRNHIENMPDRLAGELAALTEHEEVYDRLTEFATELLEKLATEAKKTAREEK